MSDKDFDIRDVMDRIGGKPKKMKTQPIIELLTEFQGEFKMFPLKFPPAPNGMPFFMPVAPGRNAAVTMIQIPPDIARTDPRPLMHDWVFMTLAFPKERYAQFLNQKWGSIPQ